ncbi:DNA-binding GntR family transcriptional regulator [Microbacterium sp. W4I4]|uniref:GntR family transcriptional regulator n=1 Tax=Microbacterium sp. W4I4 TaxID=3042295 RepID=UPI002785E848|nr:GntR family transcriptional regulator [Microbacterium sp. W4I4]MDQ0614054.1 DNA-binding GntR family transcriptional regulator [Microbacterium sp. W4I4]
MMVDVRPVDRHLPLAIHAQISDGFRTRIASGEWPPSYRLPSEPELARELAVSRGTLRKALHTLIQEGLLRQVRGKGTFVTSATIEPAIAQKLSTLSEDYASQGIVTTTEVLESGLVVPPSPVAALLNVESDGRVFRLYRRHVAVNGPVALLHNYVRATDVRGIDDIDFTKERLFATIEGVYRLKIATARRSFSAQRATAKTAELLEIAEGDPVQYLEQVTYLADGRPIEYSDVWIRSDRLRVTSLLSR